jgi:hypothetical protein
VLEAEQRRVIRDLLEDPSLGITHDKDGTFVASWKGVGVSFFRLDHYPLVLPPSMGWGGRSFVICISGESCKTLATPERSL